MAEHGETPTDEPFKPDWMNYMQGFLDGAAEEREACAKVCEEEAKKFEGYSEGAYDDRYDWKADGSMDCANAIRARGTK